MPNMGTKARTRTPKSQGGTSLADALFSTIQQRVLGYLFGQPERSFFANELIKFAGGRRQRRSRRRIRAHFVRGYNWRQEAHMKYRIALHKSEEGYSVSVPGLPGCWSQGATEQDAVENIRDAIREYLSVVEDQLHGEEIREIEVAL